MKVRFKMGWRGYREGQCLDFDDGVANVLLARGIVEVQQAPAPAVQTMVPPPAVEVAVTTRDQRPRRKG